MAVSVALTIEGEVMTALGLADDGEIWNWNTSVHVPELNIGPDKKKQNLYYERLRNMT